MVYFMVIIGDASNVSQPSCSHVVHQFCKFFNQHYFHLVKWYDNQEEMDEAKKKYLQSYGVKGLLGIIDGTMIQIKAVSGADEPAYICRKGYPALNCQVVVDYDGMFRDVVFKYPKSCHDAFIYSNSILKQTFEYDPNAGFLFAGSGYGLSPVLITLFSQPTTPEQIYFNKVHCQVRSEVERCIGRLKNRWRCLHKSGGALPYTPSTCCKIVFTCILLENLCNSLGLEVPDDIDFEYEENDVQPELKQANQVRLGIVRRNQV
ncbi:putative nuclease HARBI1 [Hydra vulgaris]|uniref:Putative nuclease HARBI1 n=1 Tax=Hydra vulgaris TaxID=6087 RepID=A0ABM4DHA7_HYDVU